MDLISIIPRKERGVRTLPAINIASPVSRVALPLGLVAFALSGVPAPLLAQSPGEEVFQATCVACHTVTTDRLVGPGLAGVQDRRDREWLISFITEPDRVIASGDSIATRLLAEYIVPMPNLGTTRVEAVAILDFIAGGGAERASAVTAAGTVTGEAGPEATALRASEDEIRFGRELFQGPLRFTNGGPTCNSCHDVMSHDVTGVGTMGGGAMGGSVMGGGTLAANLTDVFTRIGEPGVRAIIQNPPFPVMQQAYEGMPLSESEIAGLLAFLSQADGPVPMAMHQARGGFLLLVAGVGGTLLLFGLFSVIWSGRRKGSVHQEIFDRQAGSS